MASNDRTVPTLYPAFYHDHLRRAGKPLTKANVQALVRFTSWNLALNAHAWTRIVGDPGAFETFQLRFDGATYPDDRIEHMPDDMIDYLWAWDPRAHPGLHSFVDSMSGTIAEKLREYGDHLPMYLWKDDPTTQ